MSGSPSSAAQARAARSAPFTGWPPSAAVTQRGRCDRLIAETLTQPDGAGSDDRRLPPHLALTMGLHRRGPAGWPARTALHYDAARQALARTTRVVADYVVWTCTASSPAAPEAMLLHLTSAAPELLPRIAANRAAPPQALIVIAAGEEARPREETASNPRTPAVMLRRFSTAGADEDLSHDLRGQAASNPATPSDVLRRLADSTPSLRLAVARNPAADQPMLQQFAAAAASRPVRPAAGRR